MTRGHSSQFAQELLADSLSDSLSLDEQIKLVDQALFLLHREKRIRELPVTRKRLKKGCARGWKVMRGDRFIGVIVRRDNSHHPDCAIWEACCELYIVRRFSGPGSMGDAISALEEFEERRLDALHRKIPIDSSFYIHRRSVDEVFAI